MSVVPIRNLGSGGKTKRLYLVENGTHKVDFSVVTGSLSQIIDNGSDGSCIFSIGTSPTQLRASIPNDLSKYTKMHIKAQYESYAGIASSTTDGNTNNWSPVTRIDALTEVTLDVARSTGYLMLRMATNAHVYDWWLE